MHIRPRTRRRLLFLFALSGVSFALLVVAYLFSQHRHAVAMRELRAQAMSAYTAGDYEKSVRLLQDYLDKITDPDAEALFAFGKSRSAVPLPLGKHLAEGIHSFKQYLETMKPDDVAAQHELLKLYVQAGYFAEAIHQADDILAKNPQDGEALWQKVWAQVGQHREDQALATCGKLNEAEPLNIPAQNETLLLLTQTNAPADQVIAHADKLRQNHDGDPRFEVLLAEAYLLEKQDESAKKWLKTASTRTPPDAQFVAAIVASLDAAAMYDDAAAFLLRAADVIPDPLVQRLLAQRQWQNQELDKLEDRLKNQDPASGSADGSLLGYRALALFADGKTDEARKLVEAMSHRADPAAKAWAIALSTRFAMPAPSPTVALAGLTQAVARDPQNPVLHLMLAEADLNIGESELAIQECDQAFQRARSWAMPHIVAVEALLAGGRSGDAVHTAEDAIERAPNAYASQAALAKAHFALANDSGLATDYARVAAEFERIQKTWKDPQTLWIYVTALARSGRGDDAVAVIKTALSAPPPPAGAVLTKLAETADAEKLDVAGTVFDAAEKANGLTPEIAFVKARAMLEAGKEAEGLDFIFNAAKGHEIELSWRLAIANYRELWKPAEALKDWVTLGNEHPADLRLQQEILNAKSRVDDRAFWSRTIDRVKALTGEQGILWRIERGRWLLAGDPGERDKAEAVNLLTQVTQLAPALPEPHRLLAIAMEKVANTGGAISELMAAADARRGDLAITRELVGLLLVANRVADAQTYLDRLASSAGLTSESRAWLVQMYVEQGLNDKALALVADETGPAANDVQHQIILADLYRRLGRGDEAARIYESLLDKAVKNPAHCAKAADFFASRHDMATADKFLAKFAEFPLKPGELEIERAQFAEQWIGIAEAFEKYKAATRAAPQSAAAWQELIGFYMRRDRFSDAASADDQALAAVPGNADLQALHRAAITMASLGTSQEFQPLVDAISRHPQDPGATEMLSAMAAANGAKLSASATTNKLREIADRYPQNLLIQSHVIESYLGDGQIAEALELARRLAVANPNSPLPQRLLAHIYTNTGEWAKAEQAALLWREHSMDRPMAADVKLAEIYLRQPKRNAAGAVRALAPHISTDAPARNPLLFGLYVKALVQADRPEDAAALLKPLVIDSPKWRQLWLELAPLQKDAASAGKWIVQLTDVVPQSASIEQVGLAGAWYNVGVQLESPDAIETAAKVIQPLLTDTKDSQVWMVQAEISHTLGDLPGAEKWYRKVLSVEPRSAEAMNNLAYVLWLQGRAENLTEARKLSESAIAANPGDPSFYDTLARIEATTGDIQAATANFRIALQKDSTSLEAMIGLAALLAHEPSTRAQARELISQIQRLLEVNPRLPAVLRQQYEAAQDAVASSN